MMLGIVLTAAFAVTGTAEAKIDKGLYKKAAQKAWSLEEDSIFNIATPIPDSIANGQSAVIIASLDNVVGRREEQNTIYSSTGRTNRTAATHIRRRMVKLLDRSAVERYSEFTVEAARKRHSYGSVLSELEEHAFGARIYKPDGTVVNIDPETALEVSDGKKGGKNKSYKFPIPGLEPGDIIEYFYYSDYMNNDGDIDCIDMMLCDRYPTMTRVITGLFDPSLTCEYRCYNGAPRITQTKVKDKNKASVVGYDIPAVNFEKFLFEERQFPFLRLNIINNFTFPGLQPTSAKASRNGGLYCNVTAPRIYAEAREYTSRLANIIDKSTKPISDVPNRARKLVKEYVKKHPDATPRQIADAAYLAVRYCNYAGKDDDFIGSPLLLSLFHNDVINHFDAFQRDSAGIALINPRDEVPTVELAKWNQSHFLSTVNGVNYMMFPGFYYTPGQLPGIYDGETGMSMLGRISDLDIGGQMSQFKVKDHKYSGNRLTTNLTVNIDPSDLAKTKVTRDVTLSGYRKELGSDLVNLAEWLQGVEKYFGIEKPYKLKEYDPAERPGELRKALLEECAAVMGVTPDSILDYEITARGFLPDEPDMKYSMNCVVSDVAEDLGGDISVTLGRLLGHVDKIEGSERERLLDAMLPTAYQNVHLLKLKVPEGYKVDETSLEDFNRNTANPVGVFTAQAHVNEEGDLEVQCVIRMKYATVPLVAWPMLRDIYDTASRFADAAIVLVKS